MSELEPIKEISAFTREEAEEFTKKADIAFNWLSKNWDKAIEGKIWLALDYSTFTEWFVDRKLSAYKLDGIVVSKAIEQMKEDNPDITVRGMANVLDMPKSTVQNKSVRNGTDELSNYVQIETEDNVPEYPNSPNLNDKDEAEVIIVPVKNTILKKVSATVIAKDVNKFVNLLSGKHARMKGTKKEEDILRKEIDVLRNTLDEIEKGFSK